MVLEIDNLFGDVVGGMTEGSPLGGLMKSPIFVAIIIVVVILLLWNTINDDDMEVKNLVKSGLYMVAVTSIILYIHDYMIDDGVKRGGMEAEIETVLPDDEKMTTIDNDDMLAQIKSNLTVGKIESENAPTL